MKTLRLRQVLGRFDTNLPCMWVLHPIGHRIVGKGFVQSLHSTAKKGKLTMEYGSGNLRSVPE